MLHCAPQSRQRIGKLLRNDALGWWQRLLGGGLLFEQGRRRGGLSDIVRRLTLLLLLLLLLQRLPRLLRRGLLARKESGVAARVRPLIGPLCEAALDRDDGRAAVAGLRHQPLLQEVEVRCFFHGALQKNGRPFNSSSLCCGLVGAGLPSRANGPPKQSMSVDCWRQEAVGLRKGEREITKMIIKALRNIILLGT